MVASEILFLASGDIIRFLTGTDLAVAVFLLAVTVLPPAVFFRAVFLTAAGTPTDVDVSGDPFRSESRIAVSRSISLFNSATAPVMLILPPVDLLTKPNISAQAPGQSQSQITKELSHDAEAFILSLWPTDNLSSHIDGPEAGERTEESREGRVAPGNSERTPCFDGGTSEAPKDMVFFTQITIESAEDTDYLDAMRRANIKGALVGVEAVTPVYKDFNY